MWTVGMPADERIEPERLRPFADVRLPQSTATGAFALFASVCLHAVVSIALLALTFFADTITPPVTASRAAARTDRPLEIQRIVFLLPKSPLEARGGGGGGNSQPGPIRHAAGIGNDAMTLRIARPTATTGRLVDEPALPGVVLDAKPLASGTENVIGLPVGGVPFGTSTGPGSGGGVGDGTGTGIGSGTGPGVGPGSGGGIGGGVYLPGSGVTAPRAIVEVKPSYTADALRDKIQGTVVVEAIVRADGMPGNIRVIRSLDPRGLDEQAVVAVGRWRFEPGRLGGRPVDVLVHVELQFIIR
jgi:TonB family protein